MPGTTPNGLPTMLDTDPLADVALSIRNLAEAVDDKVLEPVRCFLTRTTDLTVNANSHTAIGWQASRYNDGGIWAGGGASQLLIPQSGVYAITANVQWSGSASTIYGAVKIQDYGNTRHLAAQGGLLPVNNEGNQMSATAIGYLAQGTDIRVWVWANAAQTLQAVDDLGAGLTSVAVARIA